MTVRSAFLPLVLVVCLAPSAHAGVPLELRDGDRVVLLGGTLIEREQRDGYWEAMLTLRHPDKHITFRNLGWSGDTVWGEARAGFDTPREGFRRLVQLTLSLKPTVIVLGYGGNEAFAGAAGLPRFQEGLAALLDALAPAKARIILLAPLPREDLGKPLPDPTAYNNDLQGYVLALREAGKQRGSTFLSLPELMYPLGVRHPSVTLTENGLHLTPFGYWRTGLGLAGIIPTPHKAPVIELDGAGKQVRFTSQLLPVPAPPLVWGQYAYHGPFVSRIRARALPPGSYTLHVDAQPQLTLKHDDWENGLPLTAGSDFEQVERLRAAIVEKNRLYFHRWRPQNDTYLFGFRKHEQGDNAKEVAEFDALVAKAEAEIAKLRVPLGHTYELRKK